MGVTIDDKLKFSDHVDIVRLNAHRRLFYLRKLKSFSVDSTILKLFYQSVVQSILSFCITCFYGFLTQDSKKNLFKIVKTAERICAKQITFENISDMYSSSTLLKLNKIIDDNSHPLNALYTFCPSGKRLRMPRTKCNRSRFSFIPNSIAMFNTNVTR